MTNLRFAALATLLPAALLLTGCQLTSTMPVPVAGVAFHGNFHGGQQPVAHTLVQLYVAGTNGYGVAATYAGGPPGLLTGDPVYTDANGNFNVTNPYTCPSSTAQVYLVGTGGNPGLAGNVNNQAIALMAALGPCGQITNDTYVSINELTTVASVWALSPFMSSITGVGTTGPTASTTGNFVGLTNAFLSVNKLVNVARGAVNGPALPAGATAPVARMNTLADILASCINTAGPNGNGSNCDTLFANATNNGVAPTDTISAALNMAHFPSTNVATLSTLASPASPFQPTTSPADFGLVIHYTGGALKQPGGVAIDTAGNVWVPNTAGNSVTKLDAQGVTVSDATGFLSGAAGYTAGQLNAPSSVAIDLSGNAWITNSGNSSVSELNAAGSSATVYSGGGLQAPNSVAIDAAGTAWIANTGSVTAINTSGSISTYAGVGVSSPSSIAINPR